MTSIDGRSGSRADELLADWADLAGRARRPAHAPTGGELSLHRAVIALSAPMAFAIMVIVVIGSLLPRVPEGRLEVGAGVPSPSPSSVPSLAGCLVTRPNGAHTEAWPASALDHGEGGLFTVLWPDGTVLVPISAVDRDGMGWMKFVFQREGTAEGELRLVGRRIGAEARDPRGTIRSQIPDGYGTTGVQATAIGFPAEGCWEIIAASGTSQLRFRTWVQIAPPTIGDLVGEAAPAIELAALDGSRSALPVAADRPTVVTFWGSWCPACTTEPETLARLTAETDVDAVLIAVKDHESEVSAAMGGSTLPVLLDPDGTALAAYGGFGLPLTVFIDRGGVIRSFVASPLDEASFAAGLDAIEPIARFFSEPSASPSLVERQPAASPAA